MKENNTQSTISFATLTAHKSKPYSVTSEGEIMHIFDANLIRLLSEVFRASYNILIPTDEASGTKMLNGNWTGLLGLVESSEADLAFAGILLTEERFQVFNFSYPYIISDVNQNPFLQAWLCFIHFLLQCGH